MPSDPECYFPDGYYGAPVRLSRTPRSYPFAQNGDLTTAVYSAIYTQHIAAFAPTARGTVDPENAGCYLIAETEPVLDANNQGTMCTFRRTYAKIPTTQIVYSSKFITRPNLDDVASASSWCASFDSGASSWRFTSRKSVAAIQTLASATASSSTSASGSAADPTPANLDSILGAGTFSFQRSGAGTTTGTFTGTATASTLQSLFFSSGNGFNTSVTKTDYDIYIAWASANWIIFTAPSGVACDSSATSVRFYVPKASNVTTADSLAETITTPPIPSVRQITINSHGYSAGQKLALWLGQKLVARTYVVAAVSGNVISVPLDDIAGKDFFCTHAAAAGVDTCTRYVNGSKSCSIRRTSDFYLPGVSSGIATPADIPLPTPQLDAVSWLAAVEAATAWPVESLSDLSNWQSGPMIERQVTTFQLDDALDTLTP